MLEEDAFRDTECAETALSKDTIGAMRLSFAV